jgi:hypothetical protein
MKQNICVNFVLKSTEGIYLSREEEEAQERSKGGVEAQAEETRGEGSDIV